MKSFCASSIVQHHAECFVWFPLPENAIRRLFSHHKIKTTLEDGVRPGTGMKKRTDQRQTPKRQERIKVCVKIKITSRVSISKFVALLPCGTSEVTRSIKMCAVRKHAD